MGNIMCCELNNNKHTVVKERAPKNKSYPQSDIQPVYYTNPATKDEDFTFNDKIKMQSIKNKYEVNHVPNFNDINNDASWQGIAQSLIGDINRINVDPEWANEKKNGLELIYSQKDEKILFGSKQMPTKLVNQAIINISGNTGNGYHENSGQDTNITNNSQSMEQNSYGVSQFGFSNDTAKQNSAKKSMSSNQMCINIVKLEFEVKCSAEKMLKGLNNLKKFTNKIQSQTLIEGSQNKEFSISHILFSKHMQKVQRDFVVANYYTDIGTNLNNCYASVNHYKVPELQDVVRAQIIKGGHTFFEQYEVQNEVNLTSSHRPQYNNRKASQLNQDEVGNFGNNNNNAFGSMNLNIGQVKTKVRFYGEFYCKSTFDENVVKMIFLTEFREYIGICKNIALQESVSSTDLDGESMDKSDYNVIDMESSQAEQ